MAGCKTDFLCTLEREVNNAFLPLVTKECYGSERVKHLDLNKLLRKANISTDYGYSLAHSNRKNDQRSVRELTYQRIMCKYQRI